MTVDQEDASRGRNLAAAGCDPNLAGNSGDLPAPGARVLELVRPEISALQAYHVPAADGLVKLDAMENPYPAPVAFRNTFARLLAEADINRYPDPSAGLVREALLERYALCKPLDVLFGNGSDELIQMLAMVVAGPGRTILSVEPAFVMYRMIATFTGSDYCGIPLRENFTLDMDALLSAVKKVQPALVFIAQPNNPTGNLFDRAQLEILLQSCDGLVVIDEAYESFTDSDCMDLLRKYANVVILRTFSKIGLAGLRFGMLFGHSDWLTQIDKVRLPYNINIATQCGIRAALLHFDAFSAQSRQLRSSRKELAARLAKIPGLEVYPSQANFILVRLSLEHEASAIHQALIRKRVLVKFLGNGHPLLRNCLRLTVGTPEENREMLSALRDLLTA